MVRRVRAFHNGDTIDADSSDFWKIGLNEARSDVVYCIVLSRKMLP